MKNPVDRRTPQRYSFFTPDEKHSMSLSLSSATDLAINASFRYLQRQGLLLAQPDTRLSPWIQCYWMIGANCLPGFHQHNLYVDGGSSLNISFSPARPPELAFHQQSRISHLKLPVAADLFGIRFKAGGAFQLLGWTSEEESEGFLPYYQQQFAEAFETCDRTGISPVTASDVHVLFQKRIGTIESLFARLAEKRHAQTGLIQKVMPGFIHFSGSIDQFCQQYTINRRTFERQCRAETGFSPRRLRELKRIAWIRHRITLVPDTPLVNLAQDAGFFDQAHFTHQFQKATGQTPGQYRQRKKSQIYNPD